MNLKSIAYFPFLFGIFFSFSSLCAAQTELFFDQQGKLVANLTITETNDNIAGSNDSDVLNGHGGNDLIYGLGGQDIVVNALFHSQRLENIEQIYAASISLSLRIFTSNK